MARSATGISAIASKEPILERLGTVAIVGVGLIGGSIGLALRARGLAERVVGIGRDQERLDEARRLGAIDEGTTDHSSGFASAQVAVICTPVDRIAEEVRFAAQCGPEGMLITDAGSTKRAIVEAVEADTRARTAFVGAHPIAGSERNGVSHARADLFVERVCALTPTGQTPADRLERCRAFWSALGCRVLEMSPDDHDHSLAFTSHLPHIVASALAATVPVESLNLAAGAYRDGTRVAGADSVLWSAIFLANRVPLGAAIEALESRLGRWKSAVVAGDDSALDQLWQEGRRSRQLFD
jgi:prephenate dehydrogenase